MRSAPLALPSFLPAPDLGGGDGVTAEFTQLFEAEFDFVRGAVMRQGVLASEVDDLVQETFVVAYSNWQRFVDRRQPRRWLYAIVVRLAAGARRRARTRNGWGWDAGDRDGAAEAAEGLRSYEDPALQLERRDTVRRVYQTLDRLPERFRTVLILADVEGLPVADMAAVLGLRLHAARSLLLRARRSFERVYGERLTTEGDGA